MKHALIFPGQGSQNVGMGKVFFEEFSEARMVFQEVDESLNQNLSRLIFYGPTEELNLTINAQPALMAVSIAIIRILEAHGLDIENKINYVAGHSLGEYSALCSARMFSLSDTAKLLRIRGHAMQNSSPTGLGSMAAIIGLKFDTISKICQEVSKVGICQIANDNGANQFVISGENHAIKEACSIAKKYKAFRIIMLPVSGPFHSIMMKPAEKVIRSALEKISKYQPIVPIISNVLAKPVYDLNEISELLIQQITGCVRWNETIKWFSNNKIMNLYEIGSGNILTNLAKRIDGNLNIMSLNNIKYIKEFLKRINM